MYHLALDSSQHTSWDTRGGFGMNEISESYV